VKRDVAELARHDSGVGAVVLGERIVREDLDAGAFGIGEHERLRDAGGDVAAGLGFESGLGQACRQLAEVASRRHLEGKPNARRAVAMLEHDRLLPRLGRQDRALLLPCDGA
jgi:hypothetical protein